MHTKVCLFCPPIVRCMLLGLKCYIQLTSLLLRINQSSAKNKPNFFPTLSLGSLIYAQAMDGGKRSIQSIHNVYTEEREAKLIVWIHAMSIRKTVFFIEMILGNMTLSQKRSNCFRSWLFSECSKELSKICRFRRV